MKVLIKSDKDIAQAIMSLTALTPKLDGKKVFDFEIKEHKEKRSLNANSYSWLLQGEIAKKLNRKIDDIHNEMVLQYGVIEVFSVKKEAMESVIRICDYYEILGKSELNGSTFIHIKCGIGTHLYNTKEMAHFIDGVVAEAQDLGIDTKTPDEIAQLKSLWEKEL